MWKDYKGIIKGTITIYVALQTRPHLTTSVCKSLLLLHEANPAEGRGVEDGPGEVAITTLTMGGDGKGGIQAHSIELGTQVSLGGAARLASVPDPFPWKKWTLWGMLGMGVILLGWMASRLMKQMNDKSP